MRRALLAEITHLTSLFSQRYLGGVALLRRPVLLFRIVCGFIFLQAYVWGTGTDGQLGIGDPVETAVPVKVPYLPRK